MFAERGYQRTSLDAIARRVSLTRQGVLRCFPSKGKLLIAILQHREELNREHLLAARTDEDLPSQMAAVVTLDHERSDSLR
ncbi:hypothetical protein BBK14_30050 [Parafrankia soli]|uniref:HTH tetR-type domain-containing protein n=2 Tax=Parafrankia soli TaxID=2599596 RepID=A0A1S1RIU8_9ACTN|nr:hypothetical protein BBK14_30050 [Parafrankia soli]